MAESHRTLGENAWVEFKASGYPFGLRRQLKEANGDENALEIIIPYIACCHIPTLDGGVITLLHGQADLQNVEEIFVTNIIWEFYNFRAERMREPVPKNT